MTKNVSVGVFFRPPQYPTLIFSIGVGFKNILDPHLFIKIKWYTTSVQFFSQNDQYLSSFQVILRPKSKRNDKKF